MQTSFVFSPSCYRTRRWQLPADAGESRLCLSASPAERARGCSWIEVPICHLLGFMHPQTRNQRRKAQTFCYLSPSSVQSAAAESNLVSAMPRFMVSQPHSRCWLPPGSKKPGLSHRCRTRGPWRAVASDLGRSGPQAGEGPQSPSSPWVGQHLPCSMLAGGDRRTDVPGS